MRSARRPTFIPSASCCKSVPPACARSTTSAPNMRIPTRRLRRDRATQSALEDRARCNPGRTPGAARIDATPSGQHRRNRTEGASPRTRTRYASISEFADDLPPSCRAAGAGTPRRRAYRAQRLIWRNRWPLLSVVLLLAFASGFTWRTMRTEYTARLQGGALEPRRRNFSFRCSRHGTATPTGANTTT